MAAPVPVVVAVVVVVMVVVAMAVCDGGGGGGDVCCGGWKRAFRYNLPRFTPPSCVGRLGCGAQNHL